MRLPSFSCRLSEASIQCRIPLQRCAQPQRLENACQHQSRDSWHFAYRCILHRHSTFCHVVFTRPWPPCERPNCPSAVLLFEKFKTFFVSCNVSFEQSEEFVSQYCLDALQGTASKPAITFLESDLISNVRISRNSPTLQLSRTSSSSSIICLSIGSVISHNWKAAVSEVSVTPSKMCDLLFQSSVKKGDMYKRLGVTFYHHELALPTNGSWKQRLCGFPVVVILPMHDQWGG